MLRIALGAILLYAGSIHGALAAGGYMALITKKGSFEDVRDSVEMAITDRGLVVNNVSHVGRCWNEPARNWWQEKQIFLKAEVLEFCSAVV